jgi:hypothetical protein
MYMIFIYIIIIGAILYGIHRFILWLVRKSITKDVDLRLGYHKKQK